MKPKFNIPAPSEGKRLDPTAVENFAEKVKGSDTKPKGKVESKCVLVRLTPEGFARFEEVFARSTYKSKQKMAEELLSQAIENYAAEKL